MQNVYLHTRLWYDANKDLCLLPYPFLQENSCYGDFWKSLIETRVRAGLEKYLNIDCFLDKYLEVKSALKSTGKSLKSLENSLNLGLNTGDGELIKSV